MCVGVQLTCWTRPSQMARSFPAGHREVFMGLIPKHSSTVPLVLNLGTGAITPQYHVVFDDEFTTIGTNEDSMPDLNSDLWAKLFGDSSFQFVFDDESEVHIADLPDEEDPYASALYDHRCSTILAARDMVTPVTPLPVPPPPVTPFPPPHPLRPRMIPFGRAPSGPSLGVSEGDTITIHTITIPTGATCRAPRLTIAPHSHLLFFFFTLATHGHLSCSPRLRSSEGAWRGLISHSAPLSCSPHLRSSEGASGRSSLPFAAHAQARDLIDFGPQQKVLRPRRDIGTPLC